MENGVLKGYRDILVKQGLGAVVKAAKKENKCPLLHYHAINGEYAVDINGQRVKEPDDPCGFGMVGPNLWVPIPELRGPHP